MEFRLQPVGRSNAMQRLRKVGAWCFSGVWGLGFGVLLLGCSTSAPHAPKSSSINQLHLLVTSVALNVDNKPGPDGVGVRVYASNRGHAEALPITSGALDILMFDGNLPLDELPSHQPRHTWSYPADKLKVFLQKTTIGISYRFVALWGDEKPRGDRVTFVARYTPSSTNYIYSAPSSVQVSLN